MYTRYGFKLSMLKSVTSDIYAQFLNEIYYQGIHVGYGFRALCHPAAQTFPPMATVSEELAVIYGGIRGAAVAGGHPLRLMAGYHHILKLYLRGVVGTKGRHVNTGLDPLDAVLMHIPTMAGGFGLPSFTQLFSNLSGHRDVEKLYKVSALNSCLVRANLVVAPEVREYMKSNLLAPAVIQSSMTPDRIGVSHPVTAMIGAHDRSNDVARAALKICTNAPVRRLVESYLKPEAGGGGFARAFVEYSSGIVGQLPVALVEKALATDPNAAIANLVEKIASSGMVSKLLSNQMVKAYDRRYCSDAKRRCVGFMRACGAL